MGYGKGQDLLQELAVLAGTGAKLLLVLHLDLGLSAQLQVAASQAGPRHVERNV